MTLVTHVYYLHLDFFCCKIIEVYTILILKIQNVQWAIKSVSRSVVPNSLLPHGLWPNTLLYPWNSPGKNTSKCSPSLLRGIFPTQGSNPGLPHCRQILYCLSHQGSPVVLVNLSAIIFLKHGPYSAQMKKVLK